MNELTFNGKPFTEFEAYIASSNFLYGAAKDMNSIVVPGRSGKLIQDNNRFENVTLKTRMVVMSNMKRKVDAMRNYLASCKGYCRYEESINPMEYRMASYVESFETESSDRNGAVLTLTFDAMPQRWLKTGDNWLTASDGTRINNPTLFDAFPIIRVTGGPGTIELGGTGTITLTGSGAEYIEYIDIDTDLFIAYEGAQNMSQYVQISGTPKLTGNSTTTFAVSGNLTLELKPRWYEI